MLDLSHLETRYYQPLVLSKYAKDIIKRHADGKFLHFVLPLDLYSPNYRKTTYSCIVVTDNTLIHDNAECYGLTYPILEHRNCSTVQGGKLSSIIFFDINSMRHDTIGHEAYHAAHYATVNYPSISLQTNEDVEEVKATYTGFLCSQLYPCFTKFK